MFAVILMNQLYFTDLKHSKAVIMYDLTSLKYIFEYTIQEYYVPTNNKLIDKIKHLGARGSIQSMDLDEE
jgi:hypothetical protein